MSVIPFNPGSPDEGRDAPDDRRGTVTPPAPPHGVDAEEPPSAATGSDAAARADRLEHALLDALRECATNWARAERAERLLDEAARRANKSPR